MQPLRFRPMLESDWPDIATIYQAGINTGHATFETAPPADWESFTAGQHPNLGIVAVDSTDRILGWAAASPMSARTVYAGVVEHSIYIHPEAEGHGVGTQLLSTFLDLADQAGIWTIQSSIFPRTPRACASTNAPGSVSSVDENASPA